MKSYHKELHLETAGGRAYLNITSEIAACLAESGIKEGLLSCKDTNTNRRHFHQR